MWITAVGMAVNAIIDKREKYEKEQDAILEKEQGKEAVDARWAAWSEHVDGLKFYQKVPYYGDWLKTLK